MNTRLYRKSRIYRWLMLSLTGREEWRRHRHCLIAQMSCLHLAMEMEWISLHQETDKRKAIDIMEEYMDDYKKYHDCERQYRLTNYSKHLYL